MKKQRLDVACEEVALLFVCFFFCKKIVVPGIGFSLMILSNTYIMYTVNNQDFKLSLQWFDHFNLKTWDVQTFPVIGQSISVQDIFLVKRREGG